MTISPSLTSSTRKTRPDLEAFLNIIAPDDPAGPSVRYDSLYDEVRLNRQEDDPRLSMGIWKTELKQADWGKVEELCVDALITKSKDLQIGAWLAEAWMSLDGIEGYTCGIQLVLGLTTTFWKTIHPQPQEDGDMENRYLIFEWMDVALSSRLLQIPLTQSKFDQISFGLGFYKSAQYSDASQKRADKSKSQSVNKDPSKSMGTVDEFQRSLHQTPDSYLLKQQENLETAMQVTQILQDTLAKLSDAKAPIFSQILGTLKEMNRISKSALQNRKLPSPELIVQSTSGAPEEITDLEMSDTLDTIAQPMPEEFVNPQVSINLETRDDAYRQLGIIATFLEQRDPHSLAPQLLRQLIRWENRNIVDVLGEIAKTPQEYQILMKILGAPPPQE